MLFNTELTTPNLTYNLVVYSFSSFALGRSWAQKIDSKKSEIQKRDGNTI